MKKIIAIFLLSISLWGTQNNVYSVEFDMPIKIVEESMIEHFRTVRLSVPWKLDILGKFKKAGLEKKYPKKFNKPKLSNVRTIIVCNSRYGNLIINADPKMMAYCPVRITLIEKDGITTVLFVRPSSGPKDSPAYDLLVSLENKIIKAIEDSN